MPNEKTNLEVFKEHIDDKEAFAGDIAKIVQGVTKGWFDRYIGIVKQNAASVMSEEFQNSIKEACIDALDKPYVG